MQNQSMPTKVLGNLWNKCKVFLLFYFCILSIPALVAQISAQRDSLKNSVSTTSLSYLESKSTDKTVIFSPHFKHEIIQYGGKYYKQKSSKGSFTVTLPFALKSQINLLHSGEANTSTLTFTTKIPTSVYVNDSLEYHFNLVSWQGQKTLEDFFEYDTSSLIKNYSGKIIECRSTKIKRQKAYYQIASTPMDDLKIYSISFYLKSRNHNRFYKLTSNIISDNEIPMPQLKYYLTYFNKIFEKFRIKI